MKAQFLQGGDMRKVHPPFGPDPYRIEFFHHRGHEVLPWLFFTIFVVLAALAAIALVRTWRVTPHVAAAGPVGPAGDPALAELRLRYARGDVARDEYLRRAADLGDATAAAPTVQQPVAEPPPAPPPAGG